MLTEARQYQTKAFHQIENSTFRHLIRIFKPMKLPLFKRKKRGFEPEKKMRKARRRAISKELCII
jgi:hypothetical protein